MSDGTRKALRAVLLALLFAFGIGFGIGTWLRCRMEKPPTFIGAASGARSEPETSEDHRARGGHGLRVV